MIDPGRRARDVAAGRGEAGARHDRRGRGRRQRRHRPGPAPWASGSWSTRPTSTGSASSAGRVVLEHEVTHLATRGFTGSRDADLAGRGPGRLGRVPGQRAAGAPGRRPAARGAGPGHWPGRLPVPADFKGDSPRLALAYEEAWSACRLIADRAGAAALLRLYRAVGTAAGPGGGAGRAAARATARRDGAVHRAVAARACRPSSDEAHAGRHQRLPAPGRRHPGVRARAGGPAAARLGGGVRVHLAGCGASSTRPSRSRWCGTRPRCCCRRRRWPGGSGGGPGRGLHGGLVRGVRAAGPARAGAAAGRGRADRRGQPRARGRLGRAAGQPPAAAPDRRRRGRGHLPHRVHAGPAGRRVRAAAAVRPAAARGGHRRVPAGRVRRRGPGPARAGRPADRRLRLPAGAAQGPGHADPGLAGGPRRRSRTPRC